MLSTEGTYLNLMSTANSLCSCFHVSWVIFNLFQAKKLFAFILSVSNHDKTTCIHKDANILNTDFGISF